MRRFSFIYSRLIEAHLSSMNYDAHKLPLGMIRLSLPPVLVTHMNDIGKLAKSTILNGFAALKVISTSLYRYAGC